MADTGVKYPATVSTIQETGDDNDWVTPAEVISDNGVYGNITAATFDANDLSYLLKATNPSMGVPTGATINGILVEIERHYANGTVADEDVCLTKDGSARIGDDKSTGAAFPASDAITSFGSAADLWGTTWTETEINASTFGVLYKMKATAANADGFVDFIRITVYYTVSAQTFYQSLPATAIGVAGLNKGMFVSISATAIGVATFSTVKMFSVVLNAVAQGIATLTTTATYVRVLNAVAQGVASLSKVTTYKQTLAATAIGVAGLTKVATHYITLAATAIGVPQVTKGMYKTLSAVAIGVASINTVFTAKRTLGATAQGIAGLVTHLISGAIKGTTSFILKHFLRH